MALTQNQWATTSSSGFNKFECTVVHTTSESDAYTLKTPSELDGSKPWMLSMSAAITADNAALPLDLWVGYNDDFALSGNTTAVTAGTNGGEYKTICDDCVLAVATLKYNFLMDPNLPVADVTTVAAIANGFKVRTPIAPYYAFNVDGATLIATTITWTIFQKVDGGGGIVKTNGVGADPS